MEKLLGEGAFGEVYKGLVKCPITNPKVRSSSKGSLCTPVAIKLLKCKHIIIFHVINGICIVLQKNINSLGSTFI